MKAIPRSYRSWLFHAAWLAPVALVIALTLLLPSLVTRAQDQLFDAYQRLAPRTFDAQAPVRIVDIDDASIAKVGQWPWPRTVVATLIERLHAAGAAAIGFDIVFSEGDRTSAETWIAGITDASRRAALRSALGDLPSNDAVLARAMSAAPVVLGLVLTNGTGTAPLDPPYGVAHTGADPATLVPRFTAAVAPLPALAEHAAGLGAVNWLSDGDQTVRRIPLLLGFNGQLVPGLALECLRVAQGASTFLVQASEPDGGVAAIGSVRVGTLTAAASATGDMRVRFTTHRPERFVPAWRILDGSVDPGALAGRIVIVGSSAAGLTDIRATPVDPAMPGVEVQAQAVETLLTGDRLRRFDRWGLLGGLALASLVAALLPLAPAAGSAAVAVAVVAAIGGGSWWAFTHAHLLIDPLVPSAMVLLAYGGGLSAMFRAEQRDRRFVQDAFGRFVSPDVVARLAREPDRLALGGELRQLTVMFTDVRNFSAIAERMSAPDLTRFMNLYLSPMSEIVLAQGGTVDKYIGDAIMAFWNAPLPDAAHAEHSARAALQMLAALPAVARELGPLAAGLQPIRCGIGLASGPCVVGNLGSRLRFDYSALGDDVNLASRLEGLTKVYGVDILAADSTSEAAPALAWLEADRVVVAGRTAATRIMVLVGDEATATSASFVALRTAHEAMLWHYRGRRFADAAHAATALHAQAPVTLAGLYALYRTRCEFFTRTPPPADWDGVTRMEGK